ncbi:hypothetical protein [Marinimicrococcus flavescens]|uniref:Uncharacterized protein n=1 Tax=Marinimicrococcus flavescens TaxID=3031815 RepID=A0AAP3XQS3_9PROT|nr:hypothetical protein [Marinimicrococcus flavescens]
MDSAEHLEDAVTFRPRPLGVVWAEEDLARAEGLRDSLRWRYDPRCAVEVHWGREMIFAMHRQERLRVVELQCEERAAVCPVEERRSVAEQAKIWGQARRRARQDYSFAKAELAALIEQREILVASQSWPGYLHGLCRDKSVARAEARARMAEPGHDPASDPDPKNPVFVDPAGSAFIDGIEGAEGGFAAAEAWDGRGAVDGTSAYGGTNEPDAPLAAGPSPWATRCRMARAAGTGPAPELDPSAPLRCGKVEPEERRGINLPLR